MSHLQLFAGYQKYPGADVFPAALSPCRVFSRAPLLQFESRGQGPGESCRGTHTPGKPVCLIGIQRALNPSVLVQLHRRQATANGLTGSSLSHSLYPLDGPFLPRLLPLQYSSSKGCNPPPLRPNLLGPIGPRRSTNFPKGRGPLGRLQCPLPLTSLFSVGTLLGSWHCSRVRSITLPVKFAKAYCTT